MSATKITLYEFQGKEDPTVQVEIKCLSVKENDYVISTIDTSAAWKANEDSLNFINTFHLKVGTPITETDVVALAALHNEDFSLYKNGSKVVLAPASLLITPSTDSNVRGAGGTQQYTAAITPEDASQAVTWSIETATGLSINSSGLVTWTGSTPQQTFTITAKSVADDSIQDTATITLTA